MPRITEAREFSVEELFVGMEVGYWQAAEIAKKDRTIETLGKIVKNGSVAIPYDNPGVFGIEMSEGVDMALIDKYRLEKETSAMRDDLYCQEGKLLQMVFGATVTIDADHAEMYGERVWGVGYTPLSSTRVKELIDGEVDGVVTGVHLRNSTIELENRHYSAGRLKKFIEVPILNRFGQRCTIITIRTPGRHDRVSERTIERAAKRFGNANKAIHA